MTSRTKELLFLTSYRKVVIPLVRFLLPRFAKQNEKIKDGLALRKDDPWLGPSMGEAVWIHCSSGEFEYAKPIIELLKQKQPELKIIVTFFSPSSLKNISSFPGVDLATPTPWETPEDWQNFLQHHKPRCLLIARTDLWPEMIVQTHSKNIPILLFSATLATKSGRMKRSARPFYRWLLQYISKVFCVSVDDQRNFRALGFEDATIEGDTRFDQVFVRLTAGKKIKHELFMDKPKAQVFVAGSTWPEDEAVLLKVFTRMKKQHAKLKIVLAPHEPSEAHLKQLQSACRTAGLETQRYSTSNMWESDVLLIDQVGILAELYTMASFAFVGGSFRKTVHSVMEPLAAGCLTFIGPKHFNNREALEFSTYDTGSFKMVSTVDDAAEFFAVFERMYRNDDIDTLNEQVRSAAHVKTGGSEAVANWVLQTSK